MTTEAAFCPRCGAGLPSRPPTRCTACSYALYVNARPTATVVIVDDGRFLAVRRAIEPHLGRWVLPGGFCDGWEHPAQAAVREAREELGVEVVLSQFLGMYLGPYEFQGEILPVLDCSWLAAIVTGPIRIDEREATEFAWLSLADPPELGFETMNRTIIDARKVFGG
ncbi:MAG TPA: NUDIX hydrolase [Micromonosporaceae bacterium]